MTPATNRWPMVAAAIAGASGVAIGAFGAHGLPAFLDGAGVEPDFVAKRLAQFETGARYHLVHAVALLAIAAIRTNKPNLQRWAARLFVGGIILFSGSLYVLVLTDTAWMGAITPLGGLSWIAGWAILGWCSINQGSE